MSTINWQEVLATALSSAGLFAGAMTGLCLIFRGALQKFIDRYLDTKFDIELKRREIGIESLKIFMEHTRTFLTLCPTLIAHVRAAAQVLASSNETADSDVVALRIAVKELDARLTEYFVLLPPNVYSAVHACKLAGEKILSAIQPMQKTKLLQGVGHLELKRREALTQLREWTDSLGVLPPILE